MAKQTILIWEFECQGCGKKGNATSSELSMYRLRRLVMSADKDSSSNKLGVSE